MIRAKGLDVAVCYTTFASCAPRQQGCDAGKKGGYVGVAAAGSAYCNSACPLVLAGGSAIAGAVSVAIEQPSRPGDRRALRGA